MVQMGFLVGNQVCSQSMWSEVEPEVVLTTSINPERCK